MNNKPNRSLILPTLVGIMYGTLMYMLVGRPLSGAAAFITIAVLAAIAATLAPNFGTACLLSAAAGVAGGLLLLGSAYLTAPPDDQRLIHVFVYVIWASSGGWYALLAGMLARGALMLAEWRDIVSGARHELRK